MNWLKRIGIGIGVLLLLLFVALYIYSGGFADTSRYQAEITINQPADVVFQWLTEPDKLTQWVSGFVRSEPINGDSLFLGVKSKEIIDTGSGELMEMVMEVTALEPGRLLGATMSHETMVQHIVWRLQESGGVTRLSVDADVELRAFMFRMIGEKFGPIAGQQVQSDFAKLKQLLESQ